MPRTYKKRLNDQRDYAVYRGDEFVDLGTLDYLSNVLGIARRTLQFLKSPSGRKRINGERHGIIIIKIEDGDEMDEQR